MSMNDEAAGEGELLFAGGVDGTSGQYSLPPLTAEALEAGLVRDGELRNKPTASERLLSYPVSPGYDPQDLQSVGWALIFPAEDAPQGPRNDTIYEALHELRALREEQCGGRRAAGGLYDELRGADGYRAGDSKEDFLGRHGVRTFGVADPQELPYYVLLVGSPEQIPFEFEQELSADRAVGRLYFEELEGYIRYARSVVTTQRPADRLVLPPRACLWGPQNPRDPATELSAKYLLEWLSQSWPELLRRPFGLDPSVWTLQAHLREGATKAQLGQLLAGSAQEPPPALLVIGCHGLTWPRAQAEVQRRLQGALVTSEWQGREATGAVPEHAYFCAEDLPAAADLTGLVALLVACYGLGTPHEDAYGPLSEQGTLQVLTEQPFLSRLPMQLLQRGALAVLGHVERAWPHSFRREDGKADTTFATLLCQLAQRLPIGLAKDVLTSKYLSLASRVNELWKERTYKQADQRRAWRVRFAYRYTAYADARGYGLLGDPAVRLAIPEPVRLPKKAPAAPSRPQPGGG